MSIQAYALGSLLVTSSQPPTPGKFSSTRSCPHCGRLLTPPPPLPEPNTVLYIYIKGSCKGNHDLNQNNRTAIGQFAFNPTGYEMEIYSIEVIDIPTNERAVLEAVLEALSYKLYKRSRWAKIIIVSYDQYLVNGMTSGYQNWVGKGWRLSYGKPRPNREYWESIMDLCEEYKLNGMAVECMKITKQEFNSWNII